MPFFYSLLYFQIILWNKPFWLSNSKILGDNAFTFPKNCLFWRILRVLPVPSFRHLTSWFNYFCEILYSALFPFAALLPNASFLISSPFWQQCDFYLFFPTWFIFLRTPYCLILNCNTLCSYPNISFRPIFTILSPFRYSYIQSTPGVRALYSRIFSFRSFMAMSHFHLFIQNTLFYLISHRCAPRPSYPTLFIYLDCS